jgi:hypothetical protein
LAVRQQHPVQAPQERAQAKEQRLSVRHLFLGPWAAAMRLPAETTEDCPAHGFAQ